MKVKTATHSTSASSNKEASSSKKEVPAPPPSVGSAKHSEVSSVALQDASDWQHPPNPAPGFLEMMHKAQQNVNFCSLPLPAGKGNGKGSKFTRSAPPFRPGSSWVPSSENMESTMVPQLMMHPGPSDAIPQDVVPNDFQQGFLGFPGQMPMMLPHCFPGGTHSPGGANTAQQHAALVQYQKSVQQAMGQTENINNGSLLHAPPPPHTAATWGMGGLPKSSPSNKDAPEFVPRSVAKMKKSPKGPLSKSQSMSIRVLVTFDCVKQAEAPPQILGAAKVFGCVNRFDCRKFSKNEAEPSVSIRFAAAESAANAKKFMKNILPAVSPKLSPEFIVDVELEEEIPNTAQNTRNHSISAGGSGAVTPAVRKNTEDAQTASDTNIVKSMMESLSSLANKSEELSRSPELEKEVTIEAGMLAILGALAVRCPWFNVDEFLGKFGDIVDKRNHKGGSIGVVFDNTQSANACRIAIPALKEALGVALSMIPLPDSASPEDVFLPLPFSTAASSNHLIAMGSASGPITPHIVDKPETLSTLLQQFADSNEKSDSPADFSSPSPPGLRHPSEEMGSPSVEENSALAAIIAMALEP